MKRPNAVEWLPIFRMVAFPVLLILALIQKRKIVKWLYPITLLTDIADGIIARKFKLERKQGAALDSIGDMFTLAAGVTGVVCFEKRFFKENSVAIITTIGLYLLQLVIALTRFGKPTSFHTLMSKIAMVISGSFFAHLFIFKPNRLLFRTTIASGILETIEEIILTLLMHDPQKEVRGLIQLIRK